MAPMSLSDVKMLELWNMTEGANRTKWLVADEAGPNPLGHRHRGRSTPLLTDVVVVLVLLLAMLVLDTMTLV